MKRLLFGALQASGFATLTVNRHITFLFCAAVEQNLMVKSSFDPFPSIYLEKATFMWDIFTQLLDSTAIALACVMSITV